MKGHVMLITVILSVFLFGCASADTGNNTTDTTSLNTTAAEPLATGIQMSVTPTALNLGTVDPDGLEREYYSITNVSIRTGGGTLRVSLRARGDLIGINNSSNTIPLSNLKYSIKYDGPYGPIEVPKRSLTTTYYTFWTYPDAVNIKIPVDYYLTVPLYTDPDTYRVTVTYRAL
ncbi:hypothetical protein DNK57_08845 [Methanothermobacter thermautotrophicus]|uniref:Uncharacterized protein n=1 Tax=Methanothermobacter thermautotrophicus TaxID=145262 RepID=A0A842YRB1_METTF|nr:hypothetical protein [Methanothermobacter thermautotrophicus]MBE2900891.1 hypothetical protein [Methanothermobacter thermautotrophicus]